MKYFIVSLFILFSIQVKSQHTLVLKSGEKIEGVVLSLKDDVWKIVVDRKEKKVQMREVSSVFFNEYVPYDGSLIDDGKEEVIIIDGFTVKYSLNGRKFSKEPRVSIGTEDKGTVVVKIIVDRYGNILSVEAGQNGSTTSSNYLYTKAETAAKSAKFEEDLKGPLKTEGTITIIY